MEGRKEDDFELRMCMINAPYRTTETALCPTALLLPAVEQRHSLIKLTALLAAGQSGLCVGRLSCFEREHFRNSLRDFSDQVLCRARQRKTKNERKKKKHLTTNEPFRHHSSSQRQLPDVVLSPRSKTFEIAANSRRISFSYVDAHRQP